jgi:archaellum component FlaC
MRLKKYQTDLMIAGFIFLLGFCSAYLSSRGQLHVLRLRAAEDRERIGQYQVREAKFDERFNQVKAEFATSQAAAESYRKEVSRLRTEIKQLSKP